jgi:hypothetical protein
LGQSKGTWNISGESQTNFQIPVSNYGEGVYIMKFNSNTGSINRKIILN